jgi:hypothetical protein
MANVDGVTLFPIHICIYCISLRNLRFDSTKKYFINSVQQQYDIDHKIMFLKIFCEKSAERVCQDQLLLALVINEILLK